MKRAAGTASTRFGRGDLTASLILIFPLYLAYAIGVVFSGSINGVDLVSRQLWRLCGADRTTYLLVHAGLAAAFVLWVRHARRTRTLSIEVAAPVIAEAAVYALAMGTVIRLFMIHVLERGGLLELGLEIGPTTRHVIASLGAGVHEELVFRLGLLCALAWGLGRAGLRPRVALVLAVIASALVFSWAHHLAGEPWDRAVFVYRALAGVVFALVFWYRSLAHAVYAHALYDVWVLVVR